MLGIIFKNFATSNYNVYIAHVVLGYVYGPWLNGHVFQNFYTMKFYKLVLSIETHKNFMKCSAAQYVAVKIPSDSVLSPIVNLQANLSLENNLPPFRLNAPVVIRAKVTTGAFSLYVSKLFLTSSW